MERMDNPVEETRDVCLTAILGGALSLTSPLAILSDKMLFLPICALLLLLAAFLQIFLHRSPMIGTRVAVWGFYFTLFFLSAGWVCADVYRKCEVDSARHFANQWFELMTSGRHLEALQLEKPTLQRARGLGILKRYTTEEEHVNSYKVFMENDAVKYILREFQGAEIRFVHLENMTFSRRLTSYFVVFELAKGEGLMRKTRQFNIQISAAKEYSDTKNRYDWTTRLIEIE